MPVTFSKLSLVIEAPRLIVWSAVYGMADWPEWTSAIPSLELLETPKKGARGRMRFSRTPREFEITRCEAEKVLELRIEAPLCEIVAQIRMVELAEGVAVAIEAQTRGTLEKLSARLFRARAAELAEVFLADLKTSIDKELRKSHSSRSPDEQRAG